jgi:septal ring factor EnvC (AmiA/AmiB activator)
MLRFLASANLPESKMKERKLNRATIRVASSTDIRGRATANETNRGLRTGKGRSLWRIVCSMFLSCLTLAGLLVAVAPLPARADNDKDSRHEREDNDRGIRAEIAALKASVSALESQVSTLQTANADLQKEITTLETQLAAVKSNRALLLGPFCQRRSQP